MTFLAFLALPAVILAIFFQFFTGPGTFPHDSFGIGRELSNINNQQCQRIPELEACEDMWLHRPSGLLYLACSDYDGRKAWNPAMSKLDETKRPTNDYFAIVDTRGSGPISSQIQKIQLSDFTDTLNLHGMDVLEIDSQSANEGKPTLRVIVNNHRPPIDAVTKNPLEASRHGANSTFELFETTLGENTFRHIRTYVDPAIRTPNRPAFVDANSFMFTNDHRDKVGWHREIELFVAGADVSYCDPNGCKLAGGPIVFANGLARHPTKPRVFYVPSSVSGYISVYEIQADKTLSLLDNIYTGYPADNLSVDQDGNIYAAVFPKSLKMLNHLHDPDTKTSPSAILKISLNTDQDRFYGKKYKVEKIFEDDGRIASGVTSGVFDTETKRLWLGAVLSPYIVFCQL